MDKKQAKRDRSFAYSELLRGSGEKTNHIKKLRDKLKM